MFTSYHSTHKSFKPLIKPFFHYITTSTTPTTLNTKSVCVRFAPSPTGHLHLGGLRTAIINKLIAVKYEGKYLLRIEDTDKERTVEGSTENLQDILEWASIHYDEGPRKNSINGPYIQSQRLPIYKKHALELIEKKKAYYCFCTEDRLNLMKKLQLKQGIPNKYDRHCLNLSTSEIDEKLKNNIPYVIRMKVDKTVVSYNDLIRGKLEFNSDKDMNDQVILKSDGFPTYHLANVVDDHYMKVSLVIRGEEWIASTPKHILLYDFFEWNPPQFAHLPLLLNMERKKLSKRDGASTVENFKDLGYLPEALVNFLALMGYHDVDYSKLLNINELAEKININNVGKASLVFDISKLKQVNQNYIKHKIKNDMQSLIDLLHHHLKKTHPGLIVDNDLLKDILHISQDRVFTLLDVIQFGSIYFQNPNLNSDKARAIKSNIWTEISTYHMLEIIGLFEKVDKSNFNTIFIRDLLNNWIAEKKLPKPQLIQPLRFLITGDKTGDPIEDIVPILGKDRTLFRIKNSLSLITE